ncbi:cysteine sulfinic acid decarboxylase isoform X1 [Rhineura floridana]|uniref:cysteine sulfinic acid decarboxylase isoform X1 n=2 Tax=Rhineura floridana TaxID=261503 RepID=UPI002AC7E74F|nr:cysteine sulfinic acid decarboxylase isoform X1 [Rhineura floridana]XP_061470737.1 cysteine sulfinic acid decarboxylase isoform X1 [Rhineura floridana]XP_061470738.1 cysteine sulfinic acid decarboxylase isoform X1 [Rhineura floridana]XP_061470740.1 cysteine sulfinic acid decarboxylase isoform X1 [Rhineura floridana]XP_061470741.1 cysteine sulfinic acid decarboxylase isoform X1 [Rhineura floridana]XP_061470742.1 cysteine sulfinic acid decarboxylase isoform X1 [Rhineura floridana]XP_06147074
MAEKDVLLYPALDKVAGEEFLQEAFQIMLEEGIRKGMDASEKVCNWKEPEELQQILDLELKDGGEPQERLLEHCRDVIRYSVKTCHPRFFNQLFSGLDPHALVGRLITEMLNTSQYTYEIAPVFVLMEEVVLKKLRELIGWDGGDGIFCPGGSISNMYAMNVARYHHFPDCKQKGNWAIPKLAVFTSQESHYSIQKGAAFLGIGTDNVYLVAVDEKGKMIPADLEKQINRAKSERAFPFFVSVTCGTTVLGAFDPVAEIAEVCSKHRVWLHVDAAWGGSALLSQRHRHLLDGIERADSVAWNPHKMLMTGLQCSAFLLRDSSGLLQRCHCARATYLFQTDKFYNMAYDRGDQTIQCGRKVDCLKLWLMWKANGTKGLEQRVDRAFAFTRYLADEIKKREGFQLVIEPEFINLCFWYVPPSLRGQEGCTDYCLRLGKVAPMIKERMMKKGSMMVGYQPHGNRVNFFRQVVTNPAVTRGDLDFFLDEIEVLGRDL